MFVIFYEISDIVHKSLVKFSRYCHKHKGILKLCLRTFENERSSVIHARVTILCLPKWVASFDVGICKRDTQEVSRIVKTFRTTFYHTRKEFYRVFWNCLCRRAIVEQNTSPAPSIGFPINCHWPLASTVLRLCILFFSWTRNQINEHNVCNRKLFK
jgi:hypothetical protein